MMAMNEIDVMAAALCSWKEARGPGVPGMQSVLNVVVNRMKKENATAYSIVYAPMQFSSMSAPHDPQLRERPEDNDPEYVMALSLARRAASGTLEDITDGATSYYAESMKEPPAWAASMMPTVVIGGQRFFR